MKSPYLYAFGAALYIAVIVFVMDAIEGVIDEAGSIFAPMVVLSLLVLSVATMGFLFFSEPLFLFMANKKQETVTFFLKTLGTFAGCAVFFLLALLYFT